MRVGEKSQSWVTHNLREKKRPKKLTVSSREVGQGVITLLAVHYILKVRGNTNISHMNSHTHNTTFP